ncbi:unnamed protein product, partial [marine sediment metagenome]
RLLLNMCILLLLLAGFADARKASPTISDYLVTFIIAAAIFSIFSLAIPHAWAKYAGEKILSRTYKLLMFFSILAWPILYIFQLYDGFVKRLAGVVETTPEERQEEKQEEFLNGLEQRRTEGVLDEEEQVKTSFSLFLTSLSVRFSLFAALKASCNLACENIRSAMVLTEKNNVP